MATVYLGLGSNLGSREDYLKAAIREIDSRIGPVGAQSDFIETDPWGYESDNKYINTVIKVETGLSPMEVLDETQQIERELGRTEKNVYHDRTIDIDILIYEQEGQSVRMETERLTLPHPRMEKRDFVMSGLLAVGY